MYLETFAGGQYHCQNHSNKYSEQYNTCVQILARFTRTFKIDRALDLGDRLSVLNYCWHTA